MSRVATSLADFKRGAIIRNIGSADSLVVVGNYGNEAIAVRTTVVTNPGEWLIIEEGRG